MRPDVLRVRQRVHATLRHHLQATGHVELPGPVLVRGSCPDPTLDAFEVWDGDRRYYLTTSCEYAIKRAIAAGLPAAYTLGPNFRRGEAGDRHNPEFTMLEWGRAGADLAAIEADAEAMVRGVLGDRITRDGRAIDVGGPWARRGVAELLGVEDWSPAALAGAARRAGIEVPPGWDDALSLFTLLLDAAQPGLGWERPLWLQDWPAWLTSSGIADGEVARRSELFIAGIELADGFPFLTDVDAQRAAFERQRVVRRDLGMPDVDLDRRYVDALAALPAGAGMAMGVDRLVMLAAGADDIADTLTFAWRDL